jgi:hypothetical protein
MEEVCIHYSRSGSKQWPSQRYPWTAPSHMLLDPTEPVGALANVRHASYSLRYTATAPGACNKYHRDLTRRPTRFAGRPD